jgi:3-deoxy-7-phosphoheptulonate synthase
VIVVMRAGAPRAQIETVLQRIEAERQPVHLFQGAERVVIAVLGEAPPETLREALETLPGVEEVGRTTRPYKLASREVHPEATEVRLGGLALGRDFVLGAGLARLADGPSLVELAERSARAGADLFWLLRPRGADLAQILPRLAELRRQTGLPLLVEVWGPDEIDPLSTYSDGLIVGPQHLNSYPLIRAASRAELPIVLCRGAATSVEEWLLVAEQVLQGGNFRLALCEQGIRTFEPSVHATLDFSSIAIVKRLSHLPILANPSLATGRREDVAALALGLAAAGADGLLVDVHLDQRDEATAGQQAISAADFAQLAEQLSSLSRALRGSPAGGAV